MSGQKRAVQSPPEPSPSPQQQLLPDPEPIVERLAACKRQQLCRKTILIRASRSQG